MELSDSAINPSSPTTSTPLLSGPGDQSQDDHYIDSIAEDHETTCWGCGLRLLLSPYAPIFKCGWCGAITNQNALKNDNKYFWWRRLRDRFFVVVLLTFMLFIIGIGFIPNGGSCVCPAIMSSFLMLNIGGFVEPRMRWYWPCKPWGLYGGGLWAIYPVVFSISNFCGIFHCSVAAILAVATISTYCLAAFRSPGAPPIIPWGSYPAVGKGGLEDYTFCLSCSKPKSPSAHHCRSCGMCVLDMDHHCPFIGNCVGAGNHLSFILFLISAVVSTMYVSIISAYSARQMWPSVDYSPLIVINASSRNGLILRALKEMVFAFFTSVQFLSMRGFILVYLFIASISVEIGIGVLLWQQLCYIYEGKTYLSQLNSNGDEVGERDCQNVIRFFGCPHSTSRYLPSTWTSGKSHKK